MEGRKQNDRYFSRYRETKEDALQRLKSTRNTLRDVRKLKEEIHFKTGNEFSYKMHSLRSENEKLIKIEKETEKYKRQKIVQLNFEILRIEKKLKKMTPIFRSNKIKFGKNETFKHIQQKQDLKSNVKKINVYKEYLKKLQKAKTKLST